MVRLVRGDIFESDVEALVNPVNTVGVMGKGLALQFKKLWPGNFSKYTAACRDGSLVVGKPFLVDEEVATGSILIVNFPTKKHWSAPSRLEWIEEGLSDLLHQLTYRGVRSIAIPALGCGLGGLKWSAVKGLIENTFKDSEIDVEGYPPG